MADLDLRDAPFDANKLADFVDHVERSPVEGLVDQQYFSIQEVQTHMKYFFVYLRVSFVCLRVTNSFLSRSSTKGSRSSTK
jgi:hypothetical protein